MDERNEYSQSLGTLATLPLEVRLMIYERVLIEPPKWGCIHRPDPYAVSDASQSIDHLQQPFKRLLKSRRHAREGVKLLRVSRSIHTEAISTFWEKNVFFLRNEFDFTKYVGQDMRPEHRTLLRYVYVNTFVLPLVLHDRAEVLHAPLQQALRQCTGLRTLAVNYLMSYNLHEKMFNDDMTSSHRHRAQLEKLNLFRGHPFDWDWREHNTKLVIVKDEGDEDDEDEDEDEDDEENEEDEEEEEDRWSETTDL
ncbi:hypothetical protein F4808DRAFT_368423 [Astrocystis sublimbata]|nr:hypothetical protein F4808DRAFT_368423 [Astrocystis sublimbata]